MSNNSITFVASRVITLEHNNEELRNTNGCYLVTQFSSNPTNRFILSELSFLAKVTEKIETPNFYNEIKILYLCVVFSRDDVCCSGAACVVREQISSLDAMRKYGSSA